jgi:hypothetical protein
MNGIKNIYNLHMDISFNNEHKIYDNLTKKCKKRNIYFNKKIVIPINNYNRYDFGIYIIKNIPFYGKIILGNIPHKYNKKFFNIIYHEEASADKNADIH